MGQLQSPPPELLIVAGFSRHEEALRWAREVLEQDFGPVALESLAYDFVQTEYYKAAMGSGLRKRFFVFRDLLPAERLPAIKLRTNELEAALAGAAKFPELRPLNLDPGLLSLGKLVLATTKNQAHRVYLRDGVYAEVTLRFDDGQFVPWPHTYADYRLPEALAFMKRARDYYRDRLRDART